MILALLPPWLARFFSSARRPVMRTQLAMPTQMDRRSPMTIEVERLPDYQWRELGFPQPARAAGSEVLHSAEAGDPLSLLPPKARRLKC